MIYEDIKLILATLGRDLDWGVRASVAENVDTPQENLLTLSTDTDYRVRRNVALNPSTAADILDGLVDDNEKDVRIHIAQNLNTSTATLASLALDKDLEIRSRVAANFNTSAETLKTLSRVKRAEVAMPTLTNPNTPKDIKIKILIRLSSHEEKYVLDFVSKNHDTPDDVLQILANNAQPSRIPILENSMASARLQLSLINHETQFCIDRIIQNNDIAKYSQQLLEDLSKEKSTTIRGNIAIFPLTPLKLLEKLSRDKEDTVHKNVADNVNTPENVLLKLAKDKSMFVRAAVAKNAGAPEKVLGLLSIDGETHVRTILAQNNKTSVKVIGKLCADDNSRVRMAVTRHPNASKEMLKLLSEDEDDDIRISVALHRNVFNQVRAKILKSLKTEQCRTICQKIRQDQNAYPADTLEIFLTLDEIAINEELARSNTKGTIEDRDTFKISLFVDEGSAASSSLLDKLSNSKQASVRRYIAENPNVSNGTSHLLVGDEDLAVRCKLACNTKVPTEVFTILANDAESVVRENVASNEGASIEALKIIAENKKNYLAKAPGAKFEHSILTNLARNPCVPSEILEIIVSNASQMKDDTSQPIVERENASHVCQLVATHLNITPNLAKFFASNQDYRESLAGNSRISIGVIEALVNDDNPMVRRNLARNPRLNPKKFDWVK